MWKKYLRDDLMENNQTFSNENISLQDVSWNQLTTFSFGISIPKHATLKFVILYTHHTGSIYKHPS